MESLVPLLFLVVGMSAAIWFVRKYHRPKTRIGRLEAEQARFPPGTRAWEANMALGIIDDMIASRTRELASTTAEPQRADLERQLRNLRKQQVLHQTTVDRNDLSPGTQRIGLDPDWDTER